MNDTTNCIAFIFGAPEVTCASKGCARCRANIDADRVRPVNTITVDDIHLDITFTKASAKRSLRR